MELLKLTTELVPSTLWYTNLRSLITKKQWDIIRKKCYSDANYKCEICGDTGQIQGVTHNVDCHEIWQYDDKLHIQKLIGLIALCPNCHLVKHPGYAHSQGKSELVIRQLVKINNMTVDQAIEYIENAFIIWKERSQYKWTTDISYVDTYISIPKIIDGPTIF
jgi:hypothetical protein